MATIAIAHCAQIGSEVKILNIVGGTATITDGDKLGEVPFRSLARVIINGATVDAFNDLLTKEGPTAARQTVTIITGSEEWAEAVYEAWTRSYS